MISGTGHYFIYLYTNIYRYVSSWGECIFSPCQSRSSWSSSRENRHSSPSTSWERACLNGTTEHYRIHTSIAESYWKWIIDSTLWQSRARKRISNIEKIIQSLSRNSSMCTRRFRDCRIDSFYGEAHTSDIRRRYSLEYSGSELCDIESWSYSYCVCPCSSIGIALTQLGYRITRPWGGVINSSSWKRIGDSSIHGEIGNSRGEESRGRIKVYGSADSSSWGSTGSWVIDESTRDDIHEVGSCDATRTCISELEIDSEGSIRRRIRIGESVLHEEVCTGDGIWWESDSVIRRIGVGVEGIGDGRGKVTVEEVGIWSSTDERWRTSVYASRSIGYSEGERASWRHLGGFGREESVDIWVGIIPISECSRSWWYISSISSERATRSWADSSSWGSTGDRVVFIVDVSHLTIKIRFRLSLAEEGILIGRSSSIIRIGEVHRIGDSDINGLWRFSDGSGDIYVCTRYSIQIPECYNSDRTRRNEWE